MTVKEIVTEWLKANGYDGLAYDRVGDPCGCAVGDEFMPCSSDSMDTCEAGHKVPCTPDTCGLNGECEFHIAPGLRPTVDVPPTTGEEGGERP